ncbi:MAG: hypothetical protein IT258_21220 [Saprospiraceae bacterium]|nr:hypothetical protein [Saprospiraceae bacterium]
MASTAYFEAFFFTLGTGYKHAPLLDDDGLGPIDSTDTLDAIPVIDTIPDGIPCDPDSVYFETDTLPLLISNCTMSSCHNTVSHKECVILGYCQNVLNTGDIKPINPNYGQCNTSNIKFYTFIKPVIDTHCKGLHSGNPPSGNINLSNYAGVKTIALNGKLLGTILRPSGYRKMPQGENKLDDCTISKFEAWIAAGATGN